MHELSMLRFAARLSGGVLGARNAVSWYPCGAPLSIEGMAWVYKTLDVGGLEA